MFLLWLHPFILSGVLSPLISTSILGIYPPGEFIFQCPIFLPFHTVHGVLKARILQGLAIPFSRASFQPRDQTQVSDIAGRFFTVWATREAQDCVGHSISLQFILDIVKSHQSILSMCVVGGGMIWFMLSKDHFELNSPIPVHLS